MNALGERVTQATVEKMIDAVDLNKDQHVDFNGFICLMVKKLAEGHSLEEELVTVFNRFDGDGDGEIGIDDLLSIMKELGHPCDEEEARDMIFCIDKDEDGHINFLEFVQTMMYDTLDMELEANEA
mmetsp:Transcript_26196/g.30599  ORF Transcript_26196/g.30599 Transcript_26196/m.30599 type:complete len:126 (+) Transcript_26196:219-596(+)